MKPFGFAVGLVVLVFAVSLWAQKPDPEIKKLDVFLGQWTYEGKDKPGPLGPASNVTGVMSGRKILGGFFFEIQTTEKGAMGETHAIEIDGYDPSNKAFFYNEYHDDGSMFSGAYVFNRNVAASTGKIVVAGKPYMVKATLTFAADSMSFTLKAEISTDGNAWIPFFEGQYTKAKPVPKK